MTAFVTSLSGVCYGEVVCAQGSPVAYRFVLISLICFRVCWSLLREFALQIPAVHDASYVKGSQQQKSTLPSAPCQQFSEFTAVWPFWVGCVWSNVLPLAMHMVLLLRDSDRTDVLHPFLTVLYSCLWVYQMCQSAMAHFHQDLATSSMCSTRQSCGSGAACFCFCYGSGGLPSSWEKQLPCPTDRACCLRIYWVLRNNRLRCHSQLTAK